MAAILSEAPFCFCPSCEQGQIDDCGMPDLANMLIIARPVADYQQLTGDDLSTLDLLLTLVETGTQFTAQYGDIDETFYEGPELMLDDFRDLLFDHPHLYEEGDFHSGCHVLYVPQPG